MNRRFNNKQRAALSVASNGRCELCGRPLETNWHADHVQPYSKGGETDVINGQALCPECNLKKGSSMLLPWTEILRDWQINAFNLFQKKNAPDFLAVATPGAGKTLFALRVVYDLIQSGMAQRTVIVCPTEHLKKQWAQAAHGVRLDVDPYHSSGSIMLKQGFHGIAVTYQQVGFIPDLFRHICARPTAVIFDEVHHAGENLTWGNGIKYAFEKAVVRLCLSGTPFRGDNNPIPFISYDKTGRSQADYSYTYANSLRDEVCRHLFFPKYEGRMEWVSGQGQIKEATFEDKVNLREQAERLRTAISANGNWLRQVLADAHERLLILRNNGHRNAGGLIVAMDQRHAEDIADLLAEITKSRPCVAISDDPDASDHIEQFAKSSDCWIVAVRMISEGVDIPRLRVLVYATNIQSELFFRQAAGRIVRCQLEDEERNAYFFMPDDPTLVGYAQTIKEERDHQLEEPDDSYIDPDTGEMMSVPKETESSLFLPIQADAKANGAIIGASEYSQQELDEAKRLGLEAGMPQLSPEVIALFMRRARGDKLSEATKTPAQNQTGLLWKKLKKKKSEVNALVNRYAFVTGLSHDAIHTMWLKMNRSHHRQADEAFNLEEGEAKRQWLLDQIRRRGQHE